jgi:putative oxidoreductase
MKIVSQIPAYLLALVFIVFGLAFLLKLMPTPPLEGNMASFMQLFGSTGYMTVIKVLEVVGGLLLILPRTRAMGMCIIAPISVNILLFEVLVAKQPGIGIALVLLCVLAIYSMRDRFARVIGA